MPYRTEQDPSVERFLAALRGGDTETVRACLVADADLATAVFVSTDPRRAGGRTALHVLTDWPGHVPNALDLVRALVDAGADPNAPFVGAHRETPLHWAASSDDVAALDALVDAGADLEAPGAVIGGGTPLADAVAFARWCAARRLVELGATTTLWQAAALGLVDRVRDQIETSPDVGALTNALWCACHGGQLATAQLLLAAGADPGWIGHDGLTARGAALRAGAAEVVAWLERSHDG